MVGTVWALTPPVIAVVVAVAMAVVATMAVTMAVTKTARVLLKLFRQPCRRPEAHKN